MIISLLVLLALKWGIIIFLNVHYTKALRPLSDPKNEYWIIVDESRSEKLKNFPIDEYPYLEAGISYDEFYTTPEFAHAQCDRLNNFHNIFNRYFSVKKILYIPQ